MEIKVEFDELENVINDVDFLAENCDYLQTCILSVLNEFTNEKLFGLTSHLEERLTEFDDYNCNQARVKLEEIRDNLDSIKTSFEEQDISNKEEINV